LPPALREVIEAMDVAYILAISSRPPLDGDAAPAEPGGLPAPAPAAAAAADGCAAAGEP
jgi:hypothetical protein